MSIAAPIPVADALPFASFRVRDSYTARDLARLTGLSPGLLGCLMALGKIPSAGRRVAHADLVRWLESDPAFWWYLDRLRWAVRLAEVVRP